MADIGSILKTLRESGGNLLFEGAQGSLLDVDLGTYPFVTSSNTTAGSAATGSGFGPCDIDQVLGIVKAYTTRVGGGPFPTELVDQMGEHLARRGAEFGATTGRRRRCGWFDVVALRRAIINNSISSLGITKLDVLDELDTIRVCVAYKKADGVLMAAPTGAEDYAAIEPVYENLPGWCCSTLGVRSYGELPEKAQAYLARIGTLAGIPISLVSTGPERDETIVLKNPFDEPARFPRH